MFEHYIGIDLHQAFFQACAVTVTGDRAWEDRFPRTEAGIAALVARCTPRTAVAVEASTPTWHFADAVSDRVGELRIVDPVKTKLKAGYAAKTDRLDARRLADALRRDSVVGIYLPSVAIRELRELCRFRVTIVQMRTALVQRLRAVLLRQGVVDRRRLARTTSAYRSDDCGCGRPSHGRRRPDRDGAPADPGHWSRLVVDDPCRDW
jgi:transposase